MADRRLRRAAVTAAVLTALTACGPPNEADPIANLGTDPAPTSTTLVRNAQVTVVLPPIPQVAMPDVSALTRTGDLVAEQLGDLISPISGVDLLTASCAEGGGDLVYQGSTGTDVFAIEQSGAGRYYDESASGLVTLEVEADGSGVYYDKTAGRLVTITVNPDGSGEYFSEESQGKVTLKVAGDGSGEYYDDREDALLTISLTGDGSGRYYNRTEAALLTVDARPDGSGEYYHKETTGPLVTVEADAVGGWKLTEVTTARLVELTVEPGGSGHYKETGPTPAEFDFGPDGGALPPNEGSRIEVPAAPVFSVAGRFPPLGKLGSLSPPCATVIRFEEQLLFDFNQATLRPEAGPALDQVVSALNGTGKPIEVNGHTDAKGSDDYNLELSLRRAQAVEAALRERGLTVEMAVNGLGETQPIAPNESADGADDEAGRALNRRVEIVIRE